MSLLHSKAAQPTSRKAGVIHAQVMHGGGTITTNIEMWGPKEAEQALLANHNNRPVRLQHVEWLAAAIQAGQWALSHQGIAFDVTGRLVDGQHRCKAIIMSGMTVAVMVTRGLPSDSFMVMDQGAIRSNSDVLSLPPKIVEVANLAARVANGGAAGRVSPFAANRYVSIIREPVQSLLSVAPGARRFMSSAGMRLAAALRIISGTDQTYVVSVYSDLIHGNIQNLPPIAQSLVAQVMSGTAKSGGGNAAYDVIARGTVVFDKTAGHLKKLQVTNHRTSMTWAKSVIDKALADQREQEAT